MDATKFLIRCRELPMTFPNAKNVCITGGNLDSENFNELAKMIREYIPNAFVTWNTNGVEIDESYSQAIELIDLVCWFCAKYYLKVKVKIMIKEWE